MLHHGWFKICLAIDKENRVLTFYVQHTVFLFGFLQPSLQFLLRDKSLLTFILFRSGPIAPIVELSVGDPSSLDPCKAPLVFLAVDLESVIARLSKRPLFQSTDVAAALPSFRNRSPAILRTDPSGLREVPPAVLTAPHGNISFHAAPQRVVDHVPNAGGIQHRRTASRLHRLEAERDGAERKQAGISLHIVGIIFAACACGSLPALSTSSTNFPVAVPMNASQETLEAKARDMVDFTFRQLMMQAGVDSIADAGFRCNICVVEEGSSLLIYVLYDG